MTCPSSIGRKAQHEHHTACEVMLLLHRSRALQKEPLSDEDMFIDDPNSVGVSTMCCGTHYEFGVGLMRRKSIFEEESSVRWTKYEDSKN